jgi:hypothetical protein
VPARDIPGVSYLMDELKAEKQAAAKVAAVCDIADPTKEEELEEIQGRDIEEHVALGHELPESGNTEMDFLPWPRYLTIKLLPGRGKVMLLLPNTSIDSSIPYYATFLAKIDGLNVVLASKDMYIPNEVDFINRKLVRIFITCCIHKTSPQQFM